MGVEHLLLACSWQTDRGIILYPECKSFDAGLDQSMPCSRSREDTDAKRQDLRACRDRGIACVQASKVDLPSCYETVNCILQRSLCHIQPDFRGILLFIPFSVVVT